LAPAEVTAARTFDPEDDINLSLHALSDQTPTAKAAIGQQDIAGS
jgi:hypothetical protein